MRASMLARLLISLAAFLAGCGDTFVATSGAGGTGAGGTGGQATGTGGTGGSTSGSTGGGGMVCASLALGTASCDSCLKSSCSKPYCACSTHADCMALIACANKAGPDPQSDAYQKCLQDHASSISMAEEVGQCGAQSCPACGYTYDACAACLYEHCPTDVNNCYSSPACTGYIACVQKCSANDAGCKSDCGTGDFKSGVGLAGALFTCSFNMCQAACMKK